MTANDQAVKKAKEIVEGWQMADDAQPELYERIAKALESHLVRIGELEEIVKKRDEQKWAWSEVARKFKEDADSLKESLKWALETLDMMIRKPNTQIAIRARNFIKSKFPDLFEKEKP